MAVQVRVSRDPSGSIFITVDQAGIRQECLSLHQATLALETIVRQLHDLDEPVALTGDPQLIADIENRTWRLKTGLE
ncbi:MAG: hypothetical protein ACOYZ7_19365 [Chloroflexota bacterium]